MSAVILPCRRPPARAPHHDKQHTANSVPTATPRADPGAAWDRYNIRRGDIEARWPNVGIEDMRTLVRLYDEACSALKAGR